MLNQLSSKELRERKDYLASINRQIEEATIVGSEALRDIHLEVEGLERYKASLTKQLISIRQDIQLALDYKQGEESQ